MRACREAWNLLGLLDGDEPDEDDWRPEPARLPRTPILRHDWAWTDRAACQGEDLVLFFGPDGERQPERDIRERKAKAICAVCPVRRDCLNYALTRPERSGLYGGLNEDERASERRRRMRRGELAVNAS
ncbi:WhiB family transcriptional regulator [Sphaerisporangium melleum]